MLAMKRNGWIVRAKVIWQKGNVMPSSAKDTYTADYENVYVFSKAQHYYWKTQYTPYSESTLSEIGEVYKGKAIKDYESNNVQNPSDVKRRIIASLGTTKEVYDTKYNSSKAVKINESLVDMRKSSRIIAAQFFGSKKKQQKLINFVHDHGIKFGGNKRAGGQNRTYSGKEWEPSPFGSLMRTVWKINTKPSPIQHYAIYPEELVKRMIDAGCPEKGTVFDCFIGSGTTAIVALKMGRNYLGIEYNKEYHEIATDRINFINNIV
jgi:DNA modification methylase